MEASVQSNGDAAAAARQGKSRPEPLGLPLDRRYGTMTDSPRGSRRSTRASWMENADGLPLWSFAASPQSPLIKIRDHCHQQWVAVVFTCILLAITIYFVFGLTAPMRADHCVTAFGTLLGENRGVGAYSNCQTNYGGDGMEHFVSVGLQRLYTGAKWHSLEYARRYWILSALLTFPPFSTADLLMTAPVASAVNGRRGGRGGSAVPLQHYTNMFLPDSVTAADNKAGLGWSAITGDANNVSAAELAGAPQAALPAPRDIVVYARNPKTLPHGHAAVVVAVRGPFATLAGAGGEVRWYTIKNSTAKGREVMAPESRVPRELLAKAHSIPYAGSEENADDSADAAETVAPGVDGTDVLYYKVYVAEQNWYNAYWEHPNTVLASAMAEAGANATDARMTAQEARRAATRLHNYTRVLLLHAYSKPHGFFLEDTHNNMILGWVRAPPA